MKPYIEVVGESKYLETVQEYVADINIIVRATKSETAMNEVMSLRNSCIETLISNGLKESELKEGGVEIWRDWFTGRKQKVAKEAYHKIIVCCSDISRLAQALSKLELLFDNQRYTFTINMRQPVFSASLEIRNKARSEAIENAISHAHFLAEATNVKIIHALQIEELSDIKGDSGVYGDVGGGLMMMGLAAESSDDNSYEIDNATREIKVRYRVRFSIKAV